MKNPDARASLAVSRKMVTRALCVILGILLPAVLFSSQLTKSVSQAVNFKERKVTGSSIRKKNMAQVGINLSGVFYWGQDFPFLDRMKTLSPWSAAGTGSQTFNITPNLDANGYPTTQSAVRVYQAKLPLEPAMANTSKVYVLSYTGDARFVMPGAKVISDKPGELILDLTNASGNILMYPSGGAMPNEIHLVRQDQLALYKAGEIFNPTFLQKVASFSDLRLMDLGNTNGSTVVNWSDRTTVDDLSWASNTTNDSVPLEVMVALANKSGKDIWYNIPAHASDDYVTKALTYIRDNLKSGLTVKIEYSNEVWNAGFEQNKYALAMSKSLWGDVADGSQQYYGYRSAQIAAMAKQIFATKPSVSAEVVLATQTANAGREKNIFAGVERAGVGKISDLFDVYAVTDYFGGQFAGATDADRAKILGWANSGEAGLAAAFKELETGGAVSTNYSLSTTLGWLTYQSAVASKYGLALDVYEGGVDLTSAKYSAAEQPTIAKFFNSILSDPRLGTLYEDAISGFSKAGGSTYNAYKELGTNSVWSYYGALENIYQTGSVRYDTLVKAAQAAAASDGSGPSENVPATPVLTKPTVAQIVGTDGNDTIEDKSNLEMAFVGGKGNDTYVVTSAAQSVVELQSEGNDNVRTSLASYTLGDNVENLLSIGQASFTGTGNALANTITGGNGADKLFGLDGNDTLYGGAGDDSLDGGNGDDVLDGGSGNDVMTGGVGNDIYYLDSVSDRVVEAANGGIDEERVAFSNVVLAANVENLTYLGNTRFVGSGNALDNIIVGGDAGNSLYGYGGNDTLRGGAGADVLDGGTGADAMYGGGGDDNYIVDDVKDQVFEQVDGGIDRVNSTVSYTLSPNVEYLYGFGNSGLVLQGNEIANYVSGTTGADRLYGYGGDDTLMCQAGNDWADGGEGNDLLNGGDGNDTLFGSAGNDDIYGGNGNDVLDGGSGNDRIWGGAGDDVIYGGGGSDKLYGEGGADRFVMRSGELTNDLNTTLKIMDFSAAEGDKIDLSQIDAISSTKMDDRFAFIGTAAFSKRAGELRISQGAGCWNIFMDVNGDGVPDICMTVGAKSALVQNDFIL